MSVLQGVDYLRRIHIQAVLQIKHDCMNPIHRHKYSKSISSTPILTFENLLTILPRGVVSKKDIGAYSTAESISLNRVLPALQDLRRAYSSLERANIAMPMLITT
jgi:hypothetical protein